MEDNESYVFDKLVDNDHDILGQIAYTVYKYDKIAWIEKFKEKNGKEPTEKQKIKFREDHCSEKCIKGYKSQAKEILDEYTQKVLDAFCDQIEKDYIEDIGEHLKEALEEHQKTQDGKTENLIRDLKNNIIGAVAKSQEAYYVSLQSFIEADSKATIDEIELNEKVFHGPKWLSFSAAVAAGMLASILIPILLVCCDGYSKIYKKASGDNIDENKIDQIIELLQSQSSTDQQTANFPETEAVTPKQTK